MDGLTGAPLEGLPLKICDLFHCNCNRKVNLVIKTSLLYILQGFYPKGS